MGVIFNQPAWMSQFRRGCIQLLWVSLLSLAMTSEVMAEERHSDPDGCLSCHTLEGLERVDNDGVVRTATIDKSHY